MDETGIQRIIDLSEPHRVSNNGFEYTDKELHLIREPHVKTIKLSTLYSLVQVIKAEINEYNSPIIVHVEDHCNVEVYSGLSYTDRIRDNPYCVEALVPNLAFEQKLSYESMMIALKSKFVGSPELDSLVQLLGTITEENNMSLSDDGFTQSVTVRKGIAVKGNKAVSPIVKLKPYRTFIEVEQPESEFLIRLFEGGTVALFEADGGAWKMEARNNIAAYLYKELEDLIKAGSVIVIA